MLYRFRAAVGVFACAASVAATQASCRRNAATELTEIVHNATLGAGATGAGGATQGVGATPSPDESPVLGTTTRGVSEGAGASSVTTTANAIAEPPRRDVINIGTCTNEEANSNVARFALAHVNDLQARYSERIGKHSRYAYLAGAIRKKKADKPDTLVLDGGDDYEKGSYVEHASRGESTRRIVQAMPFDVRVMGNHDFAYGEDAVARDVRESAQPVLGTNLRDLRESASENVPFAKYVRANVGCARVGLFGFVTRNYLANDKQTKEPYFGRFESETRYREIIAKVMAEHRTEVDVMIMLNHMGLAEDMGLGSYTGVDLVVGAHSEDLLGTALPVWHGDNTRAWLVQAGHYGRQFGYGDVVIDRIAKRAWLENYRIIDIDEKQPVADDIDQLVKSMEAEYAPELNEPLTRLPEAINAGRPMSELLWESLRDQFDASALIVGREAFWSGLPRGDVTLARLYESVMVQVQPSGTAGMSALTEVEMDLGDLAALAERPRATNVDVFLSPRLTADARDASKRGDKVRVYVERRLALHPDLGWYPAVAFPNPRPVGEMIDVLRPFLKKKSRAGDNH